MNRKRLILLLGGMALLACVVTLPVAAQQPRSEADVEAMTRSIAAQLRCPVCQGVSIQDSPTELANEMKAVIRQQLREGRSPEEVKAYYVERYGEWVLLQPKAEGFNLLVYVLPFVALFAGVGFVYRTVRRWSAPVDAAALDALEADDGPPSGGEPR